MYDPNKDPLEHSPYAGWMACPHCAEPIRTQGIEADAQRDTALSVLAAFDNGLTNDQIKECLRKLVDDADETNYNYVRPTTPVQYLVHEPSEKEIQRRQEEHQRRMAAEAAKPRPRPRR